MSKHYSKRFPGTSPTLVSGDSLFEWLIEDSINEVSSKTEETISSIEDIIAYGGDKAGATAEYFCEQEIQLDKIFDLLSLDLAVIFPENFDKKNEKILGRQFCLCRTNETSENNWYKRALLKYFEKPPGGSLLNYPEVQNNRNRWWLSAPSNHILCENIENKFNEEVLEPKIWKDAFEPRLFEKTTRSSTTFNERFQNFSECVFGELGQILDDWVLNSCTLLWIYVGLSEEGQTLDSKPQINFINPRKPQKKSPWGVSLFAVIKPISIPTNYDHWTENANLSRSLRKAIDQLYLYLEAEGYKSIQKRRLEKEKEVGQLNIAQAIAHEFKNLTNEVSVLGNNVNNEFRNVSITARHQLGADSDLSQQISKLAGNLARLYRISGFLSAISLATYWLTTADQRGEIEFIDDISCEILKAVAFFALDLCKATKSNWIIEDYDLEESLSVIKRTYGVANADELFSRIDFSLLLFVLNEPIRNIRNNDSISDKVKISIEVRDNSLYLCQETIESKESFEPLTSNAIKRTNELLEDVECRFVYISDQTVPRNCTKQSDGTFKINRETQIRVFKVPMQK